MTLATPKRERSVAKLTNTDEPPLKSAATEQNTDPVHHITAPFLRHRLGESKASFFRRLGEKINSARIDRALLFRAAHSFDRDGIYIYKRPVRSGSPEHAALLAQGGSVFHHVVVYVKQASALSSLEFGPGNGMDVTQDFSAEAPAGPILSHTPEHPEAQHLPMLHIDTTHHTLNADAVTRALQFAAGKAYHVMRNNCIAFADFAVRILTENRVKNAPHIFDCLVGKVPAVDSPMLPIIQALTQMTWFDITDGSRLMKEFVEAHGREVILPSMKGTSGALLQLDEEVPSGAPSGHEAQEVGGKDSDDDESGRSCDSVEVTLFKECSRDEKKMKKKGGLMALPPKPRKVAATGHGKQQT